MKVTCPTCKKVINVPEEKIPDDKPLVFKCPGCKNPVKAEKGGGGVSDETRNIPIPSGRPPEDTTNLRAIMESLESEMDMLQEGSKRALVCDPDNYSIYATVLKKTGYTISKVDTALDAINKIEANEYQLIILNEGFGGGSLDKNAVHKLLCQMNMDKRRWIFVVLISSKQRTLDNMAAFCLSVNMVINPSDFGNFELILKKAINEHETFYHVFNKMLIETGKAIQL
jgi:hypothetical protein